MIDFIHYHEIYDITNKNIPNILYFKENYILNLDKGLLVLDLKNHKNTIASSYPAQSKPIIRELDTDQIICCNLIETKVLYSEHPFFKDKQDVILGQGVYTDFGKLYHINEDFITQFVCSKAEFYGNYKPWSLRTMKKIRKIWNFNIRERQFSFDKKHKKYTNIKRLDDFTILFEILFYTITVSIKIEDPMILPSLIGRFLFHLNITSIREIYFSSDKSTIVLKIQRDFITCIDEKSGMLFKPSNDVYLKFRKGESITMLDYSHEDSFNTYTNKNNLVQVYPNVYEQLIHESKYPEYSDLYFEKVKTET